MKKFKKGFTLVELVIVIAVIAVLAAVLIPTFSGIVQRSKISADQQTITNLNTILASASDDGVIPQDMTEVLAVLNKEEKVTMSTLRASAKGYNFAWNQVDNKLFIVDSSFKVSFPENYKELDLNTKNCWIMANSTGTAQTIAKNGYNIYFDGNIGGTMTLSKWVSVDTGVYEMSGTTIINGTQLGDGAETNEITLRGSFNKVTVNNKVADASQFGSIKELTVSAIKNGSFKVNGMVDNVKDVVDGKLVNNGVITTLSKVTQTNGVVENKGSIATIASLEGTLDNQGQVSTITTAKAGSTLTNNGLVKTITTAQGAITNNVLIQTVGSVTATATLTNTGAVDTIEAGVSGATITNATGYIGAASGVTISGAQVGENPEVKTVADTQADAIVEDATSIEVGTATELANIATAVNNGTTYEGYTILLTADIDLSSRAWTPIGAKSTMPFKGSFDGAGHTITGLSNQGYIGYGNLSTVINTTNRESGTCFGLFGFVMAPTNGEIEFTGTTFNNVNIDMKSGLSVGALIGKVLDNGAVTVHISNITVNGKLLAKDKVAGIVGLAGYADPFGLTINFSNCTNNAEITAVNASKYNRAAGILAGAGGIWGATVNTHINLTSCHNTGKITANNMGHAAGLIGSVNAAKLNSEIIRSTCTNTGEISALRTHNLTHDDNPGSTTSSRYIENCLD